VAQPNLDTGVQYLLALDVHADGHRRASAQPSQHKLEGVGTGILTAEGRRFVVSE